MNMLSVRRAWLAGESAAAVLCVVFLLSLCPSVWAQKAAWRQASDAELSALLPARAPVEKEHIETEMRTASGITDGKGRFIAGVVLITAGYSADGKYSHYLIVQAPVRVGGVSLTPGEYVLGWERERDGESLSVRLHEAHSGKLLGTAAARKMTGVTRVESIRIWPPGDRAILQLGRFAVLYELAEE
jgi:hypothetical protein